MSVNDSRALPRLDDETGTVSLGDGEQSGGSVASEDDLIRLLAPRFQVRSQGIVPFGWLDQFHDSARGADREAIGGDRVIRSVEDRKSVV